jgi:hypothetical protein
MQKQDLIYETACTFTEHGFSIIPVWLRSKAPRIKWSPYQERQARPDELQKWFRQPSNAAVVCGYNHLVVLDFDEFSEYTHWLLWSSRHGGYAEYVANNAYRVKTRRGVHVYLRSQNKIRNMHLGKVDIKGQSGLVMMAGSIHPSGYQYVAMKESMIFPFIPDLESVLPPDVLARKVEYDHSGSGIQYDPNMSALDILDAPVQSSASVQEIKRLWRLEEYFPAVQRTGGAWALTQCPLHDDKAPSFWVDFDAQLCGCFSGCNDKPMDVINLYARLHKVSLQSAIQEMSTRIQS